MNRDPGFESARAAGAPELVAWLERVFHSAPDAQLLLSAAEAYIAAPIASNQPEVELWTDVPWLRAMLQRSAELAPQLAGARALTLLGALDCALPAVVGGKPQSGVSRLERAAALTTYNNLTIQLTLAERCAVPLNDRQLFTRLLHEVEQAPIGRGYARDNEIAKQRARHLLANADALFPN